jgi:two-component system, NarL family, sensor histidine kinase DesK
MALTKRWIELGRLFMVAWLTFFLLPIGVILGEHYTLEEQIPAIGILVASGLLWAWFWLRILGGPDARFRLIAVALNAVLLAVFTLMTPRQYGSLFFYAVVMAAAAYRWRVAVPVVAAAALTAGILDLVRGTTVLGAFGELINEAIVGLSVVAGRLLIDANRQLSLAREQIARLAVGEERLRFARDLHDLIGHSLSVIALKSELAGRLINATPGLAAHEVQDIEQVARDALREVRDAVAGYRQPALNAELAGAREALTAAGIQLRADGEHTPLPPAVEAVMAWAVREGVTNVLRHSQAKHCAIRIFKKDSSATVEIVDDGRGGTLEPGTGLRGLRERVLERGGTLTAEPLPHEGFRLRVTLPLPEVSAPVDRVSA